MGADWQELRHEVNNKQISLKTLFLHNINTNPCEMNQ